MYMSVVGLPSTGCVNIKKVKFDAKQDYQYIENFKLLQGSFKKKGVDKVDHPCDLL